MCGVDIRVLLLQERLVVSSKTPSPPYPNSNQHIAQTPLNIAEQAARLVGEHAVPIRRREVQNLLLPSPFPRMRVAVPTLADRHARDRRSETAVPVMGTVAQYPEIASVH